MGEKKWFWKELSNGYQEFPLSKKKTVNGWWPWLFQVLRKTMLESRSKKIKGNLNNQSTPAATFFFAIFRHLKTKQTFSSANESMKFLDMISKWNVKSEPRCWSHSVSLFNPNELNTFDIGSNPDAFQSTKILPKAKIRSKKGQICFIWIWCRSR